MNRQPLEFERSIVDLERKVEELRQVSLAEGVDFTDEIQRIERKVEKLLRETFSKLTPWQVTQLARHADRPHTVDYVKLLFEDFVELHGDRRFHDDPAVVGGLASFEGTPLVFVGHEKGRTTKERIYRNFGRPQPEGYRKAQRLMRMAERFSRPLLTFVDTQGADPGIGAEERGQMVAIAESLEAMAGLKTPILTVVIGEGGSGGALALAMADRLLMLQYATYSVITPEGCASILWRDASKAEQAAEALKLTADDLKELRVVDEILPEPLGGAHRNPEETAKSLREALRRHLAELRGIPLEELIRRRGDRYRRVGAFAEGEG